MCIHLLEGWKKKKEQEDDHTKLITASSVPLATY